MSAHFHILNGDALLARFPESIPGQRIVMRECLIDGEVSGDYPEGFWQTRARYIESTFEGVEPGSYHKKTVRELQSITAIPAGAEVNLWFEDDLFCQVNFWFAVWLLHHHTQCTALSLVRPGEESPYSFGHLSGEALVAAYEQRKPLVRTGELARLWELYKAHDLQALYAQAQSLQPDYSFIFPAVQAHLDRFPQDGKPGRPEQSLLHIMEELKTTAFGPVFMEFTRREAIYGYGDLQVKAMHDRLTGQ